MNISDKTLMSIKEIILELASDADKKRNIPPQQSHYKRSQEASRIISATSLIKAMGPDLALKRGVCAAYLLHRETGLMWITLEYLASRDIDIEAFPEEASGVFFSLDAYSWAERLCYLDLQREVVDVFHFWRMNHNGNPLYVLVI